VRFAALCAIPLLLLLAVGALSWYLLALPHSDDWLAGYLFASAWWLALSMLTNVAKGFFRELWQQLVIRWR
jgi:hypothetical protein